MRLLVDTCVLIWALLAPARLSRSARALLEDASNEIVVSAISFWEISHKHAKGKLTVRKATPEALPGFVDEMG
jgi:PIN domain nuclease of toxin-antitoxin system